MKKYFLLLILIVSCTQDKKYNTDRLGYIEPETIPYLENFKAKFNNDELYEKYRITTEFRNDFEPTKNASCMYYAGDKERVILISEFSWERLSVLERESLIFHELGHCILLRYHNNDMVPLPRFSVEESVMNEYILERKLYVLNRDYYLDELFGLSPVIKSNFDKYYLETSLYTINQLEKLIIQEEYPELIEYVTQFESYSSSIKKEKKIRIRID